MELMQGTYQTWFVLLSLFIAVFASYAAFHIAFRFNGSTAKSKTFWAIMGGFCLGNGIWTMHFIGILAYDLGITVTYDPMLFALSVICAVTASILTFLLLHFCQPQWFVRLIESAIMAAGILSVHYLGMNSMQIEADLVYDGTDVVTLSVLIALAASFAAFRLLSILPSIKRRLKREEIFLGSAIVMGLAIFGMHYSGMAGTYYQTNEGDLGPSASSFIGPGTLSVLISIVVTMILTAAVVIAFLTRRVESSEYKSGYLEDLYQSIIHFATDAIVTAEEEKGTIISWNKAAEQIYGYAEHEILGTDFMNFFPENYERKKREFVLGSVVELKARHKDGHTFPVELSLSRQGRGEMTYYTCIIRDITERVEQNQRIQELVYQDELTKLPNRRVLIEHLQYILDQASVSRIAVLFMDLNHFKSVNDVFGHHVGDGLLIAASARMSEQLQEGEFIARQSGDEFVAVLQNVSEDQVQHTVQSLIDVMNRPFVVEGYELFVSASIGVSLYPEDGKTTEQLIQYADTAMYHAKNSSENQCCFFTRDMNEEMSVKGFRESDIRKGLEAREFQLYYQPQISVADGEIKGYEALIRWEHPEHGLIYPGDFIPIAEETRQIVPLGRWVLEEACWQMMSWWKEGGTVSRVSVNISAVQFYHPNFMQMVTDVLAESGLPADYLELELTESIMQDPEQAVFIMEEMREMGVRLSLDDFGTGYTSLSCLRNFPLNSLKIDRSFVVNMTQDSQEKAIVEAIIHMAHNLNFNVIAEGIEHENQLQLLYDKACDEYQGYYYSQPLPPGAERVPERV
ncbi:bifunctional diguanylate cyclase/phosphodiesterase [Barrientosiimonas marina]|uniref:EAL domain-containing protein n=1 Tax=Lentibacillus kimchii TaxID=1542911 RepID=A0ABW2UVK1_9BACI